MGSDVEYGFRHIDLRVRSSRFDDWASFMRDAPEYSIAVEVLDDVPGHRGRYVNFDHHAGVIREATMSASMQAYIAVRQGRLMERWRRYRSRVPVYVWNADQDVCLSVFVLEYHHLLETAEGMPLLRWIVQYNNKVDVCGGLYPVNLDDLVANHVTWVFEPYRRQRMHGRAPGDQALIQQTIREVCDRLVALLHGKAGVLPIDSSPEILYSSPNNFVIADEKGDPNSRLVLGSKGYTNLISLICERPNGRYTYSVIRGCPYDEDAFPVTKLIDAFQAAEDHTESIWGGSNLAAGSDSELGSSLHWTQLREIAERVVQGAIAESQMGPPPPIEPARSQSTVLLVTAPEKRAELEICLQQCGLKVIYQSSCCEAIAQCAEARIDAVFCSPRISDGCFEDLRRNVSARCGFVPVIVCAETLDGGWVDLLEAGAYAVITEPYNSGEVRKLLASTYKASQHTAGSPA